MSRDGLERMLEFLAYLSARGVTFSLQQEEPDAIMVSVALVGHRIEVSFFVDEVQYSIFKGNEDVELDESKLRKLIDGLSA